MARIEDYALIGDMNTAALVDRTGSIDWMCIPRFDSPACFAKLLGTPANGYWRIAPADPAAKVTRSYRGDSLVLETRWTTTTGTARLVDFMPPRGNTADIVRIVQVLSGTVAMRQVFAPRFDYGRVMPWVRHNDHHWVATAGADSLWLRGEVPFRRSLGTVQADFRLSAGQQVSFVMSWAPSHLPEPALVEAAAALRSTEQHWKRWTARCTYQGDWRDAVVRSLITLKALTYEPTGGIVAAATTSLPERIGGDRNWDYRYCWLRDATLTLSALLRSGYRMEARAWRDWLLRAIAGDPKDLQIMYGVAGERRLPELTLPWLTGYEGSAPVRTGNEASFQQQLDVYGEVMDTLHVGRLAGVAISPHAWTLQKALMEHLESAWQEADAGLWEVRGAPKHFVHSKVLAWVAADRAVKTVEAGGCTGPADRWRLMRQQIHREVCEKGYDAERNCFVQSYGSTALDAATLLIPQVGFLPPDDERVIGTVDAVAEHLGHGGLVRRYRTTDDPSDSVDGMAGPEGAFLVCSFWLADALALTGRRARAEQLFEHLLSLRNDVGLLAEEWDPTLGRQVGNVPQAFTHVGVVNTALNLSGRPPRPAEQPSALPDSATTY